MQIDGIDVLHAFGAAPFVAVVEIEAFALKNECTNAILRWKSVYRKARTAVNILGRSMLFVEPLQASSETTVTVVAFLVPCPEKAEQIYFRLVAGFQVLAV